MKKQFCTRLLAVSLATATAITSNGGLLLPVTSVYAADTDSDTATDSDAGVKVVKHFDFESDTQGWYYGSGWEYQYSGASASNVSWENGRLKAAVDFSADAGYNWSNLAICYWEEGMDLSGVKQLSADVYYETDKLTDGSLKLGVYSNAGIDTYEELSSVSTADPDTGLSKAHVVFSFSALGASVDDLAIKIIGQNTSYTGALYFDNISLECLENEAADTTVTSTLVPNEGNPLSASEKQLVTTGSRESFPDSAALVDSNADDRTIATYAYLKALGATDSVIFGHQEDTMQKAGSSSLSHSDVYDVTGSISGVVGFDTLDLTGTQYSAASYNTNYSAETGITVPETTAGNVTAVALLTNDAIANGGIATLSVHMPNFSLVKEVETTDTEHSYARYDFSGYTPNDLSGDTMNQLLPGGNYNTVYNAYLDMIADYASQVNGALLFRPFHECTGSWFWWGASSCDPETFKSVYKYTVSYLRDTKNIHNLLYVYGPGSEAASTEEYEVRYPGDEYVDMVGFDMYDMDPVSDDAGYSFMKSFEQELSIVNEFAASHNKLFAVTECGVSTSKADSGDNQTALHNSGNQQMDWYNKILNLVSASDASYFLLWANFSQHDGFYTPYVNSVNEDSSLNGHEMLDNFIDFYNDDRSVFANDQKTVLSALSDTINRSTVTVTPVTTELSGYITAPVAGKRVTKAGTFAATLSQDIAKDSTAVFVLHGAVDITIPAVIDGTQVSSTVDTATIQKAGVNAEGSVELLINGTSLASIPVLTNMEEPVETVNVVDDFDTYYGYDSLLLKKWNINHAEDSSLSLSLNTDSTHRYDGSSSLKFDYSETSGGWAGATINKTADWSSYNALSFYTIPDGNAQKTVVQITANNKVYEVYLNDYAAYTASTKPVLVTIPFSAFCERDNASHPTGGLVTDAASISSLGLWVNAIDSTGNWKEGRITGTIYYDAIEAVSSSKTDVTVTPLTKKTCSITGVKSSYKKTYKNGSFILSAKCKSGGALSFTSSNKKVATVTSKGKVTLKGCGVTTITIKSKATSSYLAARKTLTLTVVPQKVSGLSLKAKSSTQISVTWKRDSHADGYRLYFSTDSKFRANNTSAKTISSNRTTSYNLKGLKKNKTYYVRIRAYKKINGKKIFGDYSTIKKVKTKK